MGTLVRLLDRLGFKKLASFWWNWQLFRCLKCGDRLFRAGDQFSCLQCRSEFPIVNGVPVFLRRLRIVEAPQPPSEASLKAVCTAYELPTDGVVLQYLRSVFGKAYRFEEGSL